MFAPLPGCSSTDPTWLDASALFSLESLSLTLPVLQSIPTPRWTRTVAREYLKRRGAIAQALVEAICGSPQDIGASRDEVKAIASVQMELNATPGEATKSLGEAEIIYRARLGTLDGRFVADDNRAVRLARTTTPLRVAETQGAVTCALAKGAVAPKAVEAGAAKAVSAGRRQVQALTSLATNSELLQKQHRQFC